MSDASALAAHAALLAASAYHVEPMSVFCVAPRSRRTRPEANARDVAVYLAHTSGGVPLRGLDEIFEISRRELRRMVRWVEEAREDQPVDRMIARLEEAFGESDDT